MGEAHPTTQVRLEDPLSARAEPCTSPKGEAYGDRYVSDIREPVRRGRTVKIVQGLLDNPTSTV